MSPQADVGHASAGPATVDHATTEALSAYLDRELPDSQARRIEEHLSDCAACQKRFAGMRGVVASLQHLERMAPPPTLAHLVARRVAFDGREKSLADRLEDGMRNFERQSSLLALFGVVVAFAVMILLFAQALEQRRNSTIPVIFRDPVPATASQAPASPTRRVAHRVLHRNGELWVEEGAESQVTRVVFFDSPLWNRLLEDHPELAQLIELDRPAVVRIGEEFFRFEGGTSGE